MEVSTFAGLLLLLTDFLIGLLFISFFEFRDKKRMQKEYFQNLEYTLSKVLNDYSDQFNLEENDK